LVRKFIGQVQCGLPQAGCNQTLPEHQPTLVLQHQV